MKKLVLSIVIVASLIGCSKTVDKDKLQQRSDGLVYEVNASEPFTGNAIEEIYGVQRTNEIYINGKKEGECVYFHDNGKKAVVKTFKNGRLMGDYKSWDRDGQQLMEATFNENESIPSKLTAWWENGQKKYEIVIDPNSVITPVEIANSNGDKLDAREFVFGKLNKLIPELISITSFEHEQLIKKYGEPSEVKTNFTEDRYQIKEQLVYNNLSELDEVLSNKMVLSFTKYSKENRFLSDVFKIEINITQTNKYFIQKTIEELKNIFSNDEIEVNDEMLKPYATVYTISKRDVSWVTDGSTFITIIYTV